MITNHPLGLNYRNPFRFENDAFQCRFVSARFCPCAEELAFHEDPNTGKRTVGVNLYTFEEIGIICSKTYFGSKIPFLTVY